MKISNKQIFLTILLLLVIVALFYPQPIWVRIALAKWRWGENAVEFYGKVVDQNNKPIADAVVSVTVPIQTGFKTQDLKAAQIRTDNSGLFSVSKQTYHAWRLRSSFLYIDNIEAPGYLFSRDENAWTYEYRSDSPDSHHPDKNNPVIFYLQKEKPSSTE